jgi:superfamily I DNA/RNA helicase
MSKNLKELSIKNKLKFRRNKNMLVGRNKEGQLVKILDSVVTEDYYCPVCHEHLIRSFGLERQYFSHEKNKDSDCEIKLKLMLKKEDATLSDNDKDILRREYYDKEFSDVNIEFSDYKSDEGYFLTQEQKDIIFSTEDRVKVSALAGSSKSTTLYYYAKERPNKKMLYVVYNKAMKIEAEQSFGKLHNVEIKTMHGLAYKHEGKYYRNKLTFNYNAVDVLKDLKLSWEYDQELAVKVQEMMKQYMLSDVEKFDDLELYKDGNNKKIRDEIIHYCEKLWELKKDRNSKVKVEHDFYLKLFQLSKKNLSREYNIILLDEAQDSSKLFLSVLLNSMVKGIVVVGDPYQTLYSWRNAINILNLFKGKEYKLTTSFRVSQNIANISNMIIEDVSNNKINMKGFNSKQKIVEKINKDDTYVCLCRTNSYIFAETIDAIKYGKKSLYYEGGYSGYNFNNIKDGYDFYCGRELNNSLFNKFKDYSQMVEYAEKSEDLELKAIIRMIDEYGSRIPELINSIKYNTTKDKSKADVIFSTIHKSKGATYTMPVLISDDHFDIENFFTKRFIKGEKINIDDFYEEMAIIYVAITRCAGEIELSDMLKKYLILRYKYFKNVKTKK